MMEVFTFTEAGGHAMNEDAFEVRRFGEHCHCTVADGQGGRSGGGEASRLACRVSLDVASGYASAKLLLPEVWAQILRAADAAVCDDAVAGFTTLIGLYAGDGYVVGASSGDSMAILINADQREETLTAQQKKNPPVGSRGAEPVGFRASLRAPWTLLAMTDGVWKYAGLDAIIQIASEMHGPEIIPVIRSRAAWGRSGGLQDDFTLVVLSESE